MTELEPAPDGYAIKLVRDLTPRIINSTEEPGDLFYARLPYDVDRVPWLKLKLAEEVAEFLVDGTADELADVQAVLDALAEHLGVDLGEIVRHDKRGGFHSGVMMYGRHPEFDK